MLKHLKKIFNVVEKEPEMGQETMQAPVLAVDNTAELALAHAALSTVQDQLTELTAKFEAAQATLALAEEAKQSLIATAAEAKAVARKAKVEAAIGTAKAPSLLAATDSLDDASFEAIVASLATSLDTEANSPMFTEKGVASEADAVVVEKPTHFNQFIKSNKE